MLKIFGSGKKKRKGDIKISNLKIPIPMVNGVQYADMTESQISTLIGGGNKGDPLMKKSVSSISSQRTNNTMNTEKTPTVAALGRSISSPPNLVMPKPKYSLPPTRLLLRSHDYEKTQVESSDDDEEEEDEESYSGESSDESDIIELFPSNVVAVDHTITKEVNHKKLSPIEESEKSPIESFISDGVIGIREEGDKNLQSLDSVTRTSDDSIRHYTSASESPFFTNSSVSHLSNNLIIEPPAFSSLLATSLIQESSSSNNNNTLPNNNSNNNSNNNNNSTSVSTNQPDINSTKRSPLMNSYSFTQEIVESPKSIKESSTPNNHNNADLNYFSSSPGQIGALNSITPQSNRREKTPVRSNNASSISPQHPTITAKQNKVTRPSSSSASSATIGLAVTPTAQTRFLNNSDKPPGNQLQSTISEIPAFVAFQNNNNNKNLLQPLENISRNHSLAISDIQRNIKKMALNEDLEELKRTVDRMQQQRVSDREEHLNRVKEQKLREKEILDQINLTKQRLEMAIAGKFFMEDLNNTNDADNNAITASLTQQQGHALETLQAQNKGLSGNTIEEEYMIKPNPTMKPSTSASTIKSKLASNPNEAVRQSESRQQQENNRLKGARKQVPTNNRHSYHQDQYASPESYFPDANKADFEYIDNLHDQPHQFFPPMSNKFRHGNIRNYHPDMEFMDAGNRYDLFDPPRTRNTMRNHPQQQRRQRSKSVESQWLPPQEFEDLQHLQRLQQQQDFSYHPVDPIDGNRFLPPGHGRIRSRKSSLHSARSNPSDVGLNSNASNHDSNSGYHSAAEKEDENENEEDEENGIENETNRHNHQIPVNGRHHSDGERPHEDHRLSSNNPGNRYRRRPPPPPLNNGHMPPSMMFHNPAFGPPPPHMSHMGMMNDRDRLKMRAPPPPPPPYGYNNMPPSGGDYYSYIPQRVSPRMMAAFNEEQQWNAPPPHHPQWGPGNQNMYGMPPPQPENITANGATANAPGIGNNGGVNGHHLQDTPNESNFGRRFPPAQTGSLQQTPQQSQHGYIPMYTDTPHRLYM